MRRVLERSEPAVRHSKMQRWPELRQSPNRGGGIVFVNERELSERQHPCRICARAGHTQVLQYHFSWTTLPVVATIG